MKMEKISDTQIKFFLTQADLVERDIRITELAYGSEKIQNLFREMLDEASDRFGVDFQNKPLMIEAIPLSLDSIVLIVTKVASEENNLFGDFLEKFQNRTADDISDIDEDVFCAEPKKGSDSEEKEMVFKFKTIDDVSVAASIISDSYSGSSALFKYRGEFYLVLDNNGNDIVANNLSEFGLKRESSSLFKYYLIEHAECIISSKAVDVLRNLNQF